MAKATPPSVSGSRVAVFVDYENIFTTRNSTAPTVSGASPPT